MVGVRSSHALPIKVIKMKTERDNIKTTMGTIYKVTCNVNGKRYIGQTINFKNRKHIHLYSASYLGHKDYDCKFHRALRKHGFNNFKWEIIEENIPIELLCIKECEYIQGFNSYKNGYNSTIGGDRDFWISTYRKIQN